jgi:hypothetical protein
MNKRERILLAVFTTALVIGAGVRKGLRYIVVGNGTTSDTGTPATDGGMPLDADGAD